MKYAIRRVTEGGNKSTVLAVFDHIPTPGPDAKVVNDDLVMLRDTIGVTTTEVRNLPSGEPTLCALGPEGQLLAFYQVEEGELMEAPKELADILDRLDIGYPVPEPVKVRLARRDEVGDFGGWQDAFGVFHSVN